jgi:hypothetical protein
MTPFATYGPIISGLVVILGGLSVIALGELFLAVRENTLNNRAAIPEDLRFSHYDYGALHVVGWVNVASGLLFILAGIFQIAYPFIRSR